MINLGKKLGVRRGRGGDYVLREVFENRNDSWPASYSVSGLISKTRIPFQEFGRIQWLAKFWRKILSPLCQIS